MLKPPESKVLGRVLEHKPTSRSEIFTTRFSNVPDIDFATWVHEKDEELTIWVAKPKKWFGTETKTPPLVFVFSSYIKGYMNTLNVSVQPYSTEFFEKENHLGFHSL
jgi:hypothetical protein|tara:strand:- start:107 stop:427 length:321 start_codon:yes stop_codon:yes gene_type:complete